MPELSFAAIKKLYGEWLVNDYDEALSSNSAACYRVYLNDLRKACEEHFGGNTFFDSLYQSYGLENWSSLRSRCAQFIEEKRANARNDREKKDWGNRRSAFHRYEEFIGYLNDDAEIAVDNQERPERTATPVAAPRPVEIAAAPANVTLQYAETFSKKELINKFLLRLKTQSRWYPDIDLLFPARLITAIFSGSRNDAWKNWMKSDLENMRVLKSDGSFERFTNISEVTIAADGSVSFKTSGGRNSTDMYTHTASNALIPFVASDPRYITIDHIVSMKNIMRQNRDSLPAFREMTDCFNAFNREHGGQYDQRCERSWMNALLEEFPELKSDSMRTRIAADLNRLELEYELMEGHENSRKSASV